MDESRIDRQHFIRTDEELASYLQSIEEVDWVALDTEFISEGRFHSELCLVQLANQEGQALVDAMNIKDLSPLWLRLCRENTEVIVHACRSEMEFCWSAIGRLPDNVFDVQLAAGFIGYEYPAGFKNLGERLLHLDIPKGETRSNWRQRPLSMLQIEYAFNDVYYLNDMADILRKRLLEMHRLEWFQEEMTSTLSDYLVSFTREGWTSLPKINNLRPRELAIAKELWNWRNEQARTRNRPAGRILRDDLLVELAKRKSAKPERVSSLRGVQHLEREIPVLCAVIEKALLMKEESLPQLVEPVKERSPQCMAINQFILTVLTDFAKQHQVAVSLLVSSKDIRDFVASAFDSLPDRHRVRLQEGWRAELTGTLLDDLLRGKIAIQLTGKNEEFPLKMVRLDCPD